MHSQVGFRADCGVLVVMVDYHGVDGSVRLDCPEVAQAIKGDGIDVLNEQSRVGMSAALRHCAPRMQAAGVDLDGYTIQEVIGDMETARWGWARD